jgi:hypothetical protein
LYAKLYPKLLLLTPLNLITGNPYSSNCVIYDVPLLANLATVEVGRSISILVPFRISPVFQVTFNIVPRLNSISDPL